MEKKTIFLVLLILGIGSVFFSFISSMKYSGYAVMDDCLIAKNRFENTKDNFECEIKEGEDYLEICEKDGELISYEHKKGVFKEWVFKKDGKEERYIYDLKTKTCKKR
jgi:hypothetical protein